MIRDNSRKDEVDTNVEVYKLIICRINHRTYNLGSQKSIVDLQLEIIEVYFHIYFHHLSQVQ